MRVKPLQRKLFTFLISSILIVALSFWVAVLVSTNSYIADQVESKLTVAEKVFRKVLADREYQLLNSAKVLTGDFGFKRAVATEDKATIESVLKNHGDRIEADLMLLISLQGELTSSNVPFDAGLDVAEEVIDNALSEGASVDYLWVGDKVYQVIFIPVSAPTPIAVAAVGFKLDQSLANDLKSITLLDVTFGISGNDKTLSISTLTGDEVDLMENRTIDATPVFEPLNRQGGFVSKVIRLYSAQGLEVDAYLSVSTDSLSRKFDVLQIEIFVISVLAIIVTLAIGSRGATKLSSPLNRLAETASEIAKGSFNQEINADGKIKEIVKLAKAFSIMQKGLAEREEKIIYQSKHDPLTSLLNRQFAIIGLDKAIESREKLVVIAINLVRFKDVNDAFGHDVGDECIKIIADRLRQVPLNALVVSRLGGDEFLLVVERDPNAVSILQQTLAKKYSVKALQIDIRFTLGVALYPESSDTANGLIQKASVALDITRREGLEVAHYDPGVEQEHIKKLELLSDLKAALSGMSEQLQMHYQPKVSPVDPASIRFEALIRWIHPEKGFISPEYFIPLSEQAGLIEQVTDWVLNRVITQIFEWQEIGVNAHVAINLSAKDLSRPQILAEIGALLDSYELPKSCIAFEITESEIMQDPEAGIALLNRFREKGFELSLDDFGTGYSSLSQLKHMPITDLKIDKSFVLKLNELTDDQIIVKSTIRLAHEFGLKVVAEGVENQASLELLTEWGCDWIQGYYISKPIAASDVAAWVASYTDQEKKEGYL